MPVRRHGHTTGGKQSHEYGCWVNMRTRCNNPKATRYDRYGGRGIRVCERWVLFDTFLLDMGLSPTAKHSLDRWPDKDGNYEPGNVRWATQSEQMRNATSPGPKPPHVRAAISRALKGRPWSPARRLAQQRRSERCPTA